MNTSSARQRIAVIGGGVSGIVAAYLLQRRHDVVLIEKNDYLGGHTHTVDVPDGPDAGTPVDTGFIVFNNHTYPCFQKFLAQLGVDYGESDMSFSYYAEESGYQYSGTGLNGFFAQRRNLFSPSHWAFLLGAAGFCRRIRRDLQDGTLGNSTLGEYCARLGLRSTVVDRLVLPMASAIWSTPLAGIRDFPVEAFARFYENHGLLSLENRPTWYYVRGGSRSYVRKFLDGFRGEVRVARPVGRVVRDGRAVRVDTEGAGGEIFDACVLACHADEALALLGDPSDDERRLLGAWRYAPNRTVLHTDSRFMPTAKPAWASWNYLRERGGRETDSATLSYHMNRLQRLSTRAEYFVTLNPARPMAPGTCIAEMAYDHPMYDFGAIRSQSELPKLNGLRNTYFCGSYFRNGFHEDGVWSAVCMAQHLGIEL